MHVLLAILWTLSGCAGAPRVSLVGEGRLALGPHLVPVVRAAAGNERFEVVLDTGSVRTLFDTTEARRMGLPVSWHPLPVILTNAPDWEFVWHRVEIAHLELGAARIEALDAPAFDVRGLFHEAGEIAAIVGEDVLRSFVLVLDAAHREAETVPAAGRSDALARRWPGREWSALPLEYEAGCPVVELDLGGGTSVRLIVDTGAEVSSFPRQALERLHARRAGELTIDGRIGGARSGDLLVLDAVELWGRRIALAVSPEPGQPGLLGMDVLALVPVAIDGPGRKLWIGSRLEGEPTRVETDMFQLAQLLQHMAEPH